MTIPKDCLQYFAKLIENEIGIVYSDVNFYQLESRLIGIAQQIGIKDVPTLWEQAKTNQLPGTAKMLILDIATNNETLFFRDQNVFRAVENILQNTISTKDKPFRVWSAACSTGQEILSLAIIRDEMKSKGFFHATILGTDVSNRVLTRAKNAQYSQLEIQRGLSAAQLVRYFEPVASSSDEPPVWQAKPMLLVDTSYMLLNLLQPHYGLGQFDLILCRNVLIYQTVENKRKVVAKLIDHLSPNGVLILGGAESLVGISDSLTWQDLCGTSIYRKLDKTAIKAS